MILWTVALSVVGGLGVNLREDAAACIFVEYQYNITVRNVCIYNNNMYMWPRRGVGGKHKIYYIYYILIYYIYTYV